MEKLKIGDLVELKSGSELMTVQRIFNCDQIDCVWFKGLELKREAFHVNTLKISHKLNKLTSVNIELLNACKKALKHHQGGHSEIGHILREVIKKAES